MAADADCKGRKTEEGDYALIPVRLTRIHTGHASAVGLIPRADDNGFDTFYVATSGVILCTEETIRSVKQAKFERPEKPAPELPAATE
jgi:hypothetical protein